MQSGASGSSSVSWLLLAPEVAVVLAWFAIRVAYPRWRARHERRVLAHARMQALVDSDFSNDELLAKCRADLALITGDHEMPTLVRDLVPLLGDRSREWLIATVREPADARVSVEIVACDVIRVLSRGQAGPPSVVVRVEVRLAVGRRRHAAQALWTMSRLQTGWTRTAVEDAWDGRRHLLPWPERARLELGLVTGSRPGAGGPRWEVVGVDIHNEPAGPGDHHPRPLGSYSATL